MTKKNNRLRISISGASGINENLATISNIPAATIISSQLRAARGLMNWTRRECAHAAKVSPETIRNIEHGTFVPQQTTCECIVSAFARHGVEFLNLINFQLNTVSGNQLGILCNVSGAVLVDHSNRHEREEASN